MDQNTKQEIIRRSCSRHALYANFLRVTPGASKYSEEEFEAWLGAMDLNKRYRVMSTLTQLMISGGLLPGS